MQKKTCISAGSSEKVRAIDRVLATYSIALRRVKIASVLVQVLGVLSAVSGAYLVGAIITGASLSSQWPLVVALVAFSTGNFLLSSLNSYWSHSIAFRTLVEMRKVLYVKLDSLAPAYVIERRSGDLARTALSDIGLLELYIAHTLPDFLQAIVVTPIALLIIGFFHWSLMLVLAPFLIAAATVPDWLAKKAEAQGRAYRDAAGRMSADTVDCVQGLREVVAFGAKETSLGKLDRAQKDYSDAYVAFEKRSGFERGVGDAILSIGMISILVLGAWLVFHGRMSAAFFPAATVLAAMAFTPIMQLMNVARQLSQTAASAERVFGIMSTTPSVADLVTSPPAGPIAHDVAFDDVRFRYRDELPEVLKGVSFRIEAGETLALVGHSGAGKSTCTYLLLRLWDPSSGAIRIGGHGLQEFPQEALRDMIAYIPQDVYLFGMSVKENIRIGRGDATDHEVEEAARRAFASEFIEDLPDKWDTVLGERGATLSGGQRQRIAIARAFLKNAPILVMDEAVSSLDTESEVAVRKAMSEVAQGRTTLIVAHRPSTIKSADRIVMLDEGT